MGSITRKLNRIPKHQVGLKKQNRYNLIREEASKLTIEDLNLLLIQKKMSQTDRAAIVHEIWHKQSLKDDSNKIQEAGDNQNALPGENTGISEEKS